MDRLIHCKKYENVSKEDINRKHKKGSVIFEIKLVFHYVSSYLCLKKEMGHGLACSIKHLAS